MLELIKKNNITKEELDLLDHYFSNEHIEELLLVENKYIFKFIENVEEKFNVSLTKIELEYLLKKICFDSKVFFDEDELEYYNKLLDITNHFNFDDCGLAYVIGDYYFYENKNSTSLKYYQMIFKPGFNLCSDGYFDSLSRYIELVDDKIEVLIKLIKSSCVNEYNLDFVNTYLLLISNLNKTSQLYINFINQAINIVTPLVREYQKDNNDIISDSDIERNLCELLALKMEYYVNKKEYLTAFEMYNKLTDEIKESGCIRYYHARDLFYNQMINLMSNDYPELKFLESINNAKFKIISCNDNLKINDIITLKNELNMTLNFKIINIYNEIEMVIAPVLPLIGLGGYLFTTLVIEKKEKYLINKI